VENYDSDNVTCLNLIEHLDYEIGTVGKEIFNYAYGRNKSYVKILMSIPGFGADRREIKKNILELSHYSIILQK
jgi:hypothetical protein